MNSTWKIRGLQHLAQFIRAGLFAISPDRPRLALATLVAFVSGIFQTVLLLVLGNIAVVLAGQPPRISRLGGLHMSFTPVMLVLLGLLMALLLLAMSVPLARLQTSLNTRAVVRARTRAVNAYLASTHSHRVLRREGYFQQLLGEYCQHIDGVVKQFDSFCVASTTLVALLLGGLFFSPKITVLLAVAVAIGIVFVGPFARRIRDGALAKSALNREMLSKSAQVIRLADEIFAFNVTEPASNEVDRQILNAAEAQRKSGYLGAIIPTLYQYGTLAVILVLIEGFAIWNPGYHPSFAPFALLLIRVLSYGRQMVSSVHSGSKDVPYVEFLEAEIRTLDAHRMSLAGCCPSRIPRPHFGEGQLRLRVRPQCAG